MSSKPSSTTLLTKDRVKMQKPISKVVYFIALTLASVILVAAFVTNGLSASPDSKKFGFKNQTGEISDLYYTEITPAGWAFAIWGVIYAWQSIWIIYSWTFLFRPSFPITVSTTSLVFYSCANACNIIWIYVWGNEHPEYAFPFIFLLGFFLYLAAGFEAVFLYRNRSTFQSELKNKIDFYIAHIAVLNGIAIYATWVTIATLLNFTIVLQYFADVSGTDAATIGLAFLTVEAISYFVLENTVLDYFARYVFTVYPVIIWALSAVINAHWGVEDNERNNIFTLVILILAIILFVVRIILLIIFKFVRPIKYLTKV